jgi:hypothetical protein
LRAAIATIEKRLAQPTADTLTAEERKARRKAKLPKGYATQAERFQKQRRLQRLRAELGHVTADWDDRVVHVVDRSKRLTMTRHHLDAAGLTLSEWRERWDCARDRIEAVGSGDESFGNLTLTVTPDGQVSLRLPKSLEHLANAKHGRYVLSGTAVFSYRDDEWRARITGGKPVSYTITRKPGRAGRYLTASWRLSLYAVNRAYTSAWGDQHWRTPYGRRKVVTRTRPADRVVRATDQAAPDDPQANTRHRHRPGTRGTKSRLPSGASTRLLGRATVTRARANTSSNGESTGFLTPS